MRKRNAPVTLWCVTLLLLLGMQPASAILNLPFQTSGDESPSVSRYRHTPTKPRGPSMVAPTAQEQAAPLLGALPTSNSTQSVTLLGEFRGAWDFVTGWLSFPYLDDDGEEVQVLLRGFFTEESEANHYSLGQWDGKLFWIDLGDGVPRLLPAQPWESNYVPEPGELPAVSGRLYHVGYLLFRQAGVSYPADQWADEAATAELWFVMDENDEQVLEFSIDLFNDNGDYLESRYLAAGDSLQIFTTAYDMADPYVVILIDYMEMKTLNSLPTITQAHWMPNIDFTDSDLAAKAAVGFDASAIELELMFEGEWYDDLGFTTYGYSNPPTALGYTWGEAKQIAAGVVSSSTASSSGGGGALVWLLLPLALVAGRRLHRGAGGLVG